MWLEITMCEALPMYNNKTLDQLSRDDLYVLLFKLFCRYIAEVATFDELHRQIDFIQVLEPAIELYEDFVVLCNLVNWMIMIMIEGFGIAHTLENFAIAKSSFR